MIRYSIDDPIAVDAAVAAVRAGELIVLPTDTVYGIGADAYNAVAVQRLLDAKERGRDMPPPVLIAEPVMIRALARHVDDLAMKLATTFWPGALTIIMPSQSSLNLDLGKQTGTIALRVPDLDFTRSLLRRTGPLAVSSANVSGRPAALTIDQAQEQLGDRVSVYLDGGEMSGPIPSTIIDMTGDHLVLRQGRVPLAALRQIVPDLKGVDDQTHA